MIVNADSKYGKNVVEIPIQDHLGSFEKGALMDRSFLGLDTLSIRYGLVGQTGMVEEETDKLHVHDYDQFLWFLSSDPNDMLTLDAEVEFTMGEDLVRQRFDTPTAIFIPKGMPHFSPVVTRLDKKVYFFAVSGTGEFHAEIKDPEADRCGGIWGEFFNPYKRYVHTLHFARKGLYHYGSAMTSDSGGIYCFGDSNPFGFSMTMSWETITKPHNLGPRTPEMGYRAHMHTNYDELLIFLSMDQDDLTDLHGEADFAFGTEEDREHAIVTKASVMLTPAGVYHLPLVFTRVDPEHPMVFVSLSGNRFTEENVPIVVSD